MADKPSAADVKALRERTGAGMMDCKQALEESGGDVDKAIEILRKKGAASAAKRSGRGTGEGLVASYVHETGKKGALVEVQCETDFVARNEDFREFARQVAIHVAAMAPSHVSVEDIPEAERENERRILTEKATESGKPEDVVEQDRRGPAEEVGGRAGAAGAAALQRGSARRQDDRGAAHRDRRQDRGERADRAYRPLRGRGRSRASGA